MSSRFVRHIMRGWVFAAAGLSMLRAQPVPLSIPRAIALALENHPSLQAATAGIRSSEAGLTLARSAYFPTLSLSASLSRTEGAFVFNPSFAPRSQSYDSYSTGVQAQELLYDFGRTGYRTGASGDFLQAAQLDYETTREAVIVNVQLAYFNLVQAERVVSVSEEAVSLAEDNLRRAKAFYSVGKGPEFDVTKAGVDLANANVNLIRARNQRRIAEVQLENAVGVHPPSEFATPDTFGVPPFKVPLDSALAVANANRPDLASAVARVSASESLVSAARSQHLPIVSAFGTWTWSGFQLPLYDRWNAGVSLSIPVFQGFGISAQVDQAQASADIARVTVDLLRESIRLDVQQSYANLREAEERIGATAQLVGQARENLRLAQKQYAAGVGTPLAVSDALFQLSNAEITNVQALHDYNSSLVTLQRAMGIVGK